MLRGAGWQPLEAGRAAAAACRSPPARPAARARSRSLWRVPAPSLLPLHGNGPARPLLLADRGGGGRDAGVARAVRAGAARRAAPGDGRKERLSLKATVIFEASWKKIEEKYRGGA